MHLLLILAVLLVRSDASGPPASPPPPAKPPIEKVVISGETFELELAADGPAREKGLMGRTKIDDHGGMLFVYRDARVRRFWMANCLVDIDILYLDAKGRITATYTMKKERPRRADESRGQYERRLKRYSSRGPAQFAIELKPGTIKRLKLRVDQAIELDLPRLRRLAKW